MGAVSSDGACMFMDKKGYFKCEYFYYGFQCVKQGILYSNIEYKD